MQTLVSGSTGSVPPTPPLRVAVDPSVIVLSPSPQGNYVSARTYYERALQLVPDSKLLKENLAKLDRLEKRLQEVQEKDQT